MKRLLMPELKEKLATAAEKERDRNWSMWQPWNPPVSQFINEYLAPEQDRVQKIWWNKTKQVFDVKLVRHWSADFCPYPNELCACSEASQEKIGEYVFDVEERGPHGPTPEQAHNSYPGIRIKYVPRKGYENIEPNVEPEQKDVKKRWKELNA